MDILMLKQVGTYILQQLSHIFNTTQSGYIVKWYRNIERFIRCRNSNIKEKGHKYIYRLWASSTKANLYIVNFLDTILDLRNNNYEPRRKPENHPVYINKNSNHPKTILRDLPKSISKRYLTCHLTKKFFKRQHIFWGIEKK